MRYLRLQRRRQEKRRSRGSDRADRHISQFGYRQQASSSSKSVSPSLRAKETLTRFLISRSDLQCFSHEEGCFAASKRTGSCAVRQQASSSSKSVSPPLRAKESLTRFLISRSDLSCASHEDGCFAACKRTVSCACPGDDAAEKEMSRRLKPRREEPDVSGRRKL